MLTAQQIINLAKKQDWWNEFTRKKSPSVAELACYAIGHKRYDYFILGAFEFDDHCWFSRAEKFVELCKMEEKRIQFRNTIW